MHRTHLHTGISMLLVALAATVPAVATGKVCMCDGTCAVEQHDCCTSPAPAALSQHTCCESPVESGAAGTTAQRASLCGCEQVHSPVHTAAPALPQQNHEALFVAAPACAPVAAPPSLAIIAVAAPSPPVAAVYLSNCAFLC